MKQISISLNYVLIIEKHVNSYKYLAQLITYNYVDTVENNIQ